MLTQTQKAPAANNRRSPFYKVQDIFRFFHAGDFIRLLLIDYHPFICHELVKEANPLYRCSRIGLRININQLSLVIDVNMVAGSGWKRAYTARLNRKLDILAVHSAG